MFSYLFSPSEDPEALPTGLGAEGKRLAVALRGSAPLVPSSRGCSKSLRLNIVVSHGADWATALEEADWATALEEADWATASEEADWATDAAVQHSSGGVPGGCTGHTRAGHTV